MCFDFLIFFYFLIISIVLAFIIFFLSCLVAYQNADKEKLSPYECGFDPFQDSRGLFDVRFYLVAILFIIFDLEVSFLFPWSLVFGKAGFFSFWVVWFFLMILTLGFIYEWSRGALEWE